VAASTADVRGVIRLCWLAAQGPGACVCCVCVGGGGGMVGIEPAHALRCAVCCASPRWRRCCQGHTRRCVCLVHAAARCVCVAGPCRFAPHQQLCSAPLPRACVNADPVHTACTACRSLIHSQGVDHLDAVLADGRVRSAYEAATGGAGGTQGAAAAASGGSQGRKPVEGDCPICFSELKARPLHAARVVQRVSCCRLQR
jgi:hypothetical protein